MVRTIIRTIFTFSDDTRGVISEGGIRTVQTDRKRLLKEGSLNLRLIRGDIDETRNLEDRLFFLKLTILLLSNIRIISIAVNTTVVFDTVESRFGITTKTTTFVNSATVDDLLS